MLTIWIMMYVLQSKSNVLHVCIYTNYKWTYKILVHLRINNNLVIIYMYKYWIINVPLHIYNSYVSTSTAKGY